eukprot:m.26084 g.26084  ORF g.26084 m.26084 type:complete len:87 (-) comp11656_c0_seq1:877-1137(-)
MSSRVPTSSNESWEGDQQVMSMFLDKKAELKAEQAAYVADHPELTAIVNDFMQHVLLNKPDDCFQAAAEFFGTYAEKLNVQTPESS